MTELNILFTSVGRRVALLHQFAGAHDALGLSGKLIAVDRKNTAPARYVADVFHQVPRVDDADYIRALLEICTTHEVDLLFPLIDPELYPISNNVQAFLDIGTRPVISDPATIRIGMDKRSTAAFFEEIGVDSPKILDITEVLRSESPKFPMLIKPARGSSSIGVTKIYSKEELAFFSSYIEDPVLQEFVEGDEYTLDILTDFSGEVHCVVPRLRIETRAGEVSKGITVKNRQIMDAGARVAKALPGPVGCITVQCFVAPCGNLKFIEINPRFGGGVPLAIKAGADFPRWLMEMYLGLPSTHSFDSWQDELMMLRFDDAVFVSDEGVS